MAIIPSAISPLVFDEMPLVDLLTGIGNRLAEGGDMHDWCVANYGRPATVFAGTDPDNPPAPEAYPLIELFAVESNHGREIGRHERTIGLTLGVYNESLDPVSDANGFTLQQGIVDREELFRLVMTAMATTDMLGGYIAQVQSERSDDSFWPFYLLGAEILIVKPVT